MANVGTAGRSKLGELRRDRVRRIVFGLILVLLVQYLLGMVTNLFVKIPTAHPGAKASDYFSGVGQAVAWAVTDGGGLWLALHAAIGLLLIVGAAVALQQSVHAKRRAAIVSTVVGLLCTIGAGFNGASFLNYGEDASSMIMAALFAVTLGAYAFGGYLLGHRHV